MKPIWQSFLLFIVLFSCNTKNEKASVFSFIPNTASIVLHINSIENLETNLSNNDFLQTFSKFDAYKKTATLFKPLSQLKSSQPIVISFLKDTNDSLQYTFSIKQTPELLKIDSLSKLKSEVITINAYPSKKLTYKGDSFFVTTKDSIAFGSSSKTVLEALIANTKNTSIENYSQTIDKTKPVSIILNHTVENPVQTVFLSDSLSFSNFSNYSTFDVDIEQDLIVCNGITKATDSTKSLINIFKNTIPQDHSIAKITPVNHDGFLSFTFDDFAVFKTNLDAFNSIPDSTKTTPSLFNNIQEIGILLEHKNKSIVLKSIETSGTKDALLSEENIADTYRQVSIFNFSKPELFRNTLSPLITFNEANFYCVIDTYFVFSNSIENLQNIITSYQNKTTFSESNYYNSITPYLSDASSFLQVVKPSALKQILETNLNTKIEKSLTPYKASAVQYIYDSNFAHFNAVIKKNKKVVEEKSITELFNIKLESDLLNAPQFVTNSRTKGKDIVVQDINNMLYLISNTGTIVWKKQLKSAILGKIEQLDFNKNGTLELAFATTNNVHIITRKGKYVDGFPKKFNDDITQPLSVFDYDNNKKYRLFVTQNKNVLVYDAKGKPVKGFNFKSANTTINYQPQHFRIQGKDYIVVKTNSKIHILNRRGKTRVKPNTTFKFSNQAVFNYKNSFTTTTKNGNLISIGQNGNAKETSLNLTENHSLFSTLKTLVTLSENKLTIRDKTLELDFGNYTNPKIFFINDKIYVSTTDLQTQKVMLFDSQAKPIDNFPVYGNAAIDLENIDKNKNLEFVTKGESNSILVYRIN